MMRLIRLTLLSAISMAATGPVLPHAHGDTTPTSQPAESNWFKPPRRLLTVDDLSLELGTDSSGSNQKVRTDRQLGQPRPYGQRDKYFSLDETVGVRSDGSLIRDDVMRYDLFLRGGLTQNSYNENRPWPSQNPDTNPNGHLLEYDLRLQTFQAGKISGTVYASQLEGRIPRPFLPTMDQERKRYGTTLTYNDAKLPMSLSWETSDNTTKSGQGYYYDDSERENEDHLSYEATWQAADSHSVHLEYEYQDVSDQYSGTRTRFDTQRNLLSLDDSLQFGDQKKNRLDSLLRLDDEQGQLAQDTFELSSNLHLQHTDNLFTTYRAQYLKENYYQISSETWRGDVGVTHLFKDLLTSSINIYGLEQDVQKNPDIDEWGTLSNFNLNKEHETGRFSSNLSYLHSSTQSHGGQRDGIVLNESVTFRDPLPAILAHTDVNVLTVIVTSADRRRVYLPGRDYIVIWVGRYASLQRIPTGFILDRQTVLVSYTYRVSQDYELNRDRVDLRVQEDFKMGLSPYFAMTLQDEEVAHDKYLTWNERNIHRYRVGTTYRQPKWSFGPEYEFNHDSVDPFQAGHLNGDVTLLCSAKQQLTGRITLSRFFFEGQDYYTPAHDTTMIDAGLNYSYQLASRLEAAADAMYRFETDTIYGRTEGIDLRGTVSYRIGLFTILFELEYDSLDLPNSTDDSVAFWVKIRREIPVIGEGTH